MVGLRGAGEEHPGRVALGNALRDRLSPGCLGCGGYASNPHPHPPRSPPPPLPHPLRCPGPYGDADSRPAAPAPPPAPRPWEKSKKAAQNRRRERDQTDAETHVLYGPPASSRLRARTCVITHRRRRATLLFPMARLARAREWVMLRRGWGGPGWGGREGCKAGRPTRGGGDRRWLRGHSVDSSCNCE